MTRSQFERFFTRGSLLGVAIGGVVGLIVGLFTYVPTCLFALVEGALLGGIVAVLGSLLLYPLVVGAGRLGLPRATRR